jgi:hypothetical protein
MAALSAAVTSRRGSGEEGREAIVVAAPIGLVRRRPPSGPSLLLPGRRPGRPGRGSSSGIARRVVASARTAPPCRPASTSACRPVAAARGLLPRLGRFQLLEALSRSAARPGLVRRRSAYPTAARTAREHIVEPLLADRVPGLTRGHIWPSSLWSPLASAFISCLRCSLRAAGPSLRRPPALTEHRWSERPETRHGPTGSPDRAFEGWAVYRSSLTPPATPPKQPRRHRSHGRSTPRRAYAGGAPLAWPRPPRPPRRRGPPS